MAPFSATSIFESLDSEDVGSLRRVMDGVLHRLAGVRAADVVRQHRLQVIEELVVEHIVAETNNDNDAFRTMAIRFASAHNANPATVLRAAQEFDAVTPQDVLGPVNLRSEQTIAGANVIFRDFVDNGIPFAYEPSERDIAANDSSSSSTVGGFGIGQDVAMAAERDLGEDEYSLENDLDVSASLHHLQTLTSVGR